MFNADIIRNTETNDYRGIFEFENCICEVEAHGWREFTKAVEHDAGIRIPEKKHFNFERLSDWEQIAGIDASHTRPQGCIVTMEDRKNGWNRWTF